MFSTFLLRMRCTLLPYLRPTTLPEPTPITPPTVDPLVRNAVVAYALEAGSYFEVTVRGVAIDAERFREGWLDITLDLECEHGTRARRVVLQTVPAMVGELPRSIRDAVGDWTE